MGFLYDALSVGLLTYCIPKIILTWCNWIDTIYLNLLQWIQRCLYMPEAKQGCGGRQNKLQGKIFLGVGWGGGEILKCIKEIVISNSLLGKIFCREQHPPWLGPQPIIAAGHVLIQVSNYPFRNITLFCQLILRKWPLQFHLKLVRHSCLLISIPISWLYYVLMYCHW